MTIWHWLAAIALVIVFTRTKGAVRGGLVILTITFFVARVAYLWLTKERLP